MSISFEFQAKSRTEHGKAVARRMRTADLIPAVVYGAGKDPQSITLLHKDLLHALENEAIFSHILKLSIDGKDEPVVIKDVQRHPYKPKIVHVDFFRVNMNEKITMDVPLHFEGEEDAPGIQEGGQFTKNVISLEIRCLPNDLPEFIPVNVASMKLDDVLHISNIKLPKGTELAHAIADEAHDLSVISCHVPHVSKEDIEAEQHEAELAAESAAESSAEHAAEEEAQPEAAADEGTEKEAPADKE